MKAGQTIMVTPVFSGPSLNTGNVIIFEIPDCHNALSLEPFASFTITSYSSTNFKREETLNGIVYDQKPMPLSLVSVKPVSYVPGEVTNYVL